MSQFTKPSDEIYCGLPREHQAEGEMENDPIDAEIWRFFFAPPSQCEGYEESGFARQ